MVPGGEALQPVVVAMIMAALVAALVWAAWSDIATRRIPNWVCVAVGVLGFGLRLQAGWVGAMWSLLAALALFAVLVFAHARGVMGGGDVKLAAAAALALSPPDIYGFVVATSLAGGVLAVLHLLLRRVLAEPVAVGRAPGIRAGDSVLRRVFRAEHWRIRRRGPLPYGVAIAAGGIWVLLGHLGE